MSNVGDGLAFLKRTHQLLESGRMVVKIHGKHLDQLCKLLQFSKRLQNKKSPGHSDIGIPDKTEELSAHDGSVYRSCVGILLYLSPDLPQCQYVIRYLSTFSSKPTQKTIIVLKHLVGYLAGHADQYVSLRWKGIHSGLLKDYEGEEPKCSVMQIGHQTVTLDDQCQELPFSWKLSGLPVERRRLCHFPAQSQKRMQQPAQ